MRRRVALLAVCCVLCTMARHSRQQRMTALHREGYGDTDNCNTYATFGDHFSSDKNITCPYFLNHTYLSHNDSSCRDLDNLMQNDSVRWCFELSPLASDAPVGIWSVCLNTNGSRTFYWSNNNTNNDPESIQVLPNGQLNLFPINSFMRDAQINCSVVNREGRECGFEEFAFTLLTRTTVPRPRILQVLPPNDNRDPSAHVGELMFLCVSGITFGVQDLNWRWSHDSPLETINITARLSDPPCLTCDCARSRYANNVVVGELLRNKTEGGARGVAFSVLGYVANGDRHIESLKCSEVPSEFLSFLMIDGARSEDNGVQVEVEVVALLGDSREGSFTLKTSYLKYGPVFNNINPQMYNGHHVFMCDAFISGDANLEWRNNADDSSVRFLYSGEFTNRSDLSNTTLDQLCSRENSPGELFAVRFNNSYLKDMNNATYINQAVALVQCSHHRLPTSTRYTCFSSDNSTLGTSFTLQASGSCTQIVTITMPLVIFVTILILVI